MSFPFERNNLYIWHSSQCINVMSYGTTCLNTLHTSSTKRLWSTTDRLLFTGANNHSSVASATSPDGTITLILPLAMVLNKSSKDVLGSVLSRVPNNDQSLGSTRIARPYLDVPHHYQHEVNETNHMHKIISIMKMWRGVPHLHVGGNRNQAIKFDRR